MEFFAQFGLLFSNMQWYVAVCIAVGIVLLLIEVFEPGFGIFGISGIVLLVLSIVLRTVIRKPEDNPIAQVFQMLLLFLIIGALLFILLAVATKKNWLKKTPLIQSGTAVNEDFSDGTENYSSLIGKEGKAVTDLRPSGKAEIDGKVYDVVADNFFINVGKKIKVNNVEGSKIGVEIIKNKDKESKLWHLYLHSISPFWYSE